jgi:hypothetical protein
MATTGRKQFTEVDQVATGDREWSSLTPFGPPDNNSSCPVLDTEQTNQIRFCGFDLSSASGAVSGIAVYLAVMDPWGYSGIIPTVSLVNADGSVVARVNPEYQECADEPVYSHVVVRYGSESDNWGLSLADLAGLKVLYEISNGSGDAGESFDVAPSIIDCHVEVWSE